MKMRRTSAGILRNEAEKQLLDKLASTEKVLSQQVAKRVRSADPAWRTARDN